MSDKKQCVSRKEFQFLEWRVAALERLHRPPDVVKRSPLPKDYVVKKRKKQQNETLEARVTALERLRSPLPKDQVVKRRKKQQKRRKVPS